jgi:4-hydroxybenzoate polyprenyltransferase
MSETVQSREQQGRVADAPSGHWVYRALPRRRWPYAQLARWDRPIGWWLLLWPCWWSAAMAGLAGAGNPAVAFAPFPNPWHLALFLIGAVAMRGAGCTYNDLVDQGIDEKVARTRSRPLPSGQVTRRQAKLFMAAQAFIGFLVLVQFNLFTVFLGFLSLAVVAVYPFMKRVTDWPQLTLGLAFSWGAWMGWAAIYGSVGWPPALLYAGAILWTIGYDTIYAHQDKEDDALVGVRSTARLFGAKTKPWLVGLYGGSLALIAGAYATAGITPVAYAGLAAAGAHMMRQIRILDIDDADQCLRLFKSNAVVGWLIFGGLLLGAAVQALGG